MAREFSYLKHNLVKHIQGNKSHLQAVADKVAQEAAKNELMSKNRKAGLNLGRLCMEKYLKGRPYIDYEDDVMMLAQSGAIVGELNHSRKFPAALRPYVTKVVHRRVEKFVHTPLYLKSSTLSIGGLIKNSLEKQHCRGSCPCQTWLTSVILDLLILKGKFLRIYICNLVPL